MSEWLVNNWALIIVAIAAIVAIVNMIKNFVSKPTPTQIAQIKEWLLWAVTEAEKTLGSGTGALKLRYVYDLFVTRFPIVAQIVSFDIFSQWVDEVLEKFRSMLNQNTNVKTYVEHKEDK